MDSVSGHWVRQGNLIILNGLGPVATEEREFSRIFPWSVPNFPAKPAGAPGGFSLPVSLFPPKPPDPLVTDPKLEGAINKAIVKLERDRNFKPNTYPVRFTFVDVTNGSGPFPSGGHGETLTDYIASEAKVAVMYSAYALRDMVRRFAAATGANKANLFTRLAKQMDPSIINASRKIAVSLLTDGHRVPSYKDVFALTPTSGQGVTVSFSPAFNQALEGMIVPSDNQLAGRCVRGVGYGYLNGVLEATGFFDSSSPHGGGLWVAGDFQQGKNWPSVGIVSSNDGFVAQAGTTRDMAKLVSLIMTDGILDAASCAEMRGRLARSAKIPPGPWISRTGIFPPGTITHNKLGLGSLKSKKPFRSEVSVYQSPVKRGRRYVVAWQNLITPWPIGVVDLAGIIKSTITEFER